MVVTVACAIALLVVGGSSHGARVDRFDEDAAWTFLVRQVELGPRPAGSTASRRLGALLRSSLPGARFQRVPGGLRNVIATVPGRNPRRVVVVGAHYDTKDLDGFVGANDNASGVAVVRQLARTIRPRALRPTVVFVFFDGEETPRGVPDSQILRRGLRGSKVAARSLRGAEAMILVDLVGDRLLRIPRDVSADPGLWRGLQAASTRARHEAPLSVSHLRDPRRPHSLRPRRRADAAARGLRLPLLAQAVRRPLRGLKGEPGRSR